MVAMRLISLNTWGGKLYDLLLPFIRRFQKKTNLFCLQEVFKSTVGLIEPPADFGVVPNLYERLANQLRGFHGYITEPSPPFGERLAIFGSGSTMIDDQGDMVLCEPREIEVDNGKVLMGSKLQWVTFKHESKVFTIANVHGIWLPSGKKDTPERIKQSERIVAFLESREDAKVLCGDLNLSPETRSIRILEANMRNLVREHKVTTTRSSYYDPGKEKFADYIFTSSHVRVSDFKVLKEEVSDHLPLMLEFG